MYLTKNEIINLYSFSNQGLRRDCKLRSPGINYLNKSSHRRDKWQKFLINLKVLNAFELYNLSLEFLLPPMLWFVAQGNTTGNRILRILLCSHCGCPMHNGITIYSNWIEWNQSLQSELENVLLIRFTYRSTSDFAEYLWNNWKCN